MAKFLIQGSYTVEGAKGLAKDGASSRRQVIDTMLKGLGGRLESFYFAFGDADVFVIADVPDNITAAAISVAVNTSGAVQTRTTVLLSAEEFDQALKKHVAYKAPGR